MYSVPVVTLNARVAISFTKHARSFSLFIKHLKQPDSIGI